MTSCGVVQLSRCSDGSQRRQELMVLEGKGCVFAAVVVLLAGLGREKCGLYQGVPPRSKRGK